MPRIRQIAVLMTLGLLNPVTFAQAQDKDESTTTEAATAASGQEVEVNEDMYRQFMELKDARQQRMIMPEDAFKPGSGSQKLDKLPEESQRHLRDQLREVILQGGQWQPGDELTDHPYVPSPAAVNDRQLQSQEAEAWGELLASYHKREEQIYQNSARSRAAMASQSGNPGQSGNPSNSAGQSSGSASSSGGQTASEEQQSRQNQSGQPQNNQERVPEGAKITRSSSSAGVSQNAKEFLQQMQQRSGQSGHSDTADVSQQAMADNATEEGPGGPETEPNDVTQDSESTSPSQTRQASANPASPQAGENTAGTSQNALEFLQQQGQQGEAASNPTTGTNSPDGGDGTELVGTEVTSDQQPGGNPSEDASNSEPRPGSNAASGDSPGATQNALEYVIGERPADTATQGPTGSQPVTAGGTLSIRDLGNARGVGTGRSPQPSQGPATLPPLPEPPPKSPPDKDGN